MNLKAYYQKIREVERTLVEPFAVLVSHATPDGGRDGILVEVPSQLAAKMIADGRARLAASDEARDFRQKTADAKRVADEEAMASRMQVTIVPTAELRKSSRPAKE
jgi:hypothetical protein